MIILAIIFGLLCAGSGIYCMMTPVESFLNLAGWLVGVSMIFEGVSTLIRWNARRRLGFASAWGLVGGIVSIALGAYVVYNGAMQIAIDTMIAYLVAFWLVFAGIARIVTAFDLRKLKEAGSALGENWVRVLIAGILVLIMGCLCAAHPVVAMAGIGFLAGLGMTVAGISAVIAALSI